MYNTCFCVCYIFTANYAWMTGKPCEGDDNYEDCLKCDYPKQVLFVFVAVWGCVQLIILVLAYLGICCKLCRNSCAGSSSPQSLVLIERLPDRHENPIQTAYPEPRQQILEPGQRVPQPIQQSICVLEQVQCRIEGTLDHDGNLIHGTERLMFLESNNIYEFTETEQTV